MPPSLDDNASFIVQTRVCIALKKCGQARRARDGA